MVHPCAVIGDAGVESTMGGVDVAPAVASAAAIAAAAAVLHAATPGIW